ncbi:hypothetical protein U0070_017694, partial [Myodes glareolus]
TMTKFISNFSDKALVPLRKLQNGLVASELWMWFYIRKIISKRGIIAMIFEDQSLTVDLI